jgi:hypothetical protein
VEGLPDAQMPPEAFIHRAFLPKGADVHRIMELAWHRKPEDRTPLPKVGDTVLFRQFYDGDVQEATVEWVQHLHDTEDPNVMRRNQWGIFEPQPDPWPMVRLLLADKKSRVTCRECRVPDAPGWMPKV